MERKLELDHYRSSKKLFSNIRFNGHLVAQYIEFGFNRVHIGNGAYQQYKKNEFFHIGLTVTHFLRKAALTRGD